jgi:hypothetical protein
MTLKIVTNPEEVADLLCALDFEPHEADDWFGFANYAQKDKGNPALARKIRTFGEAICHRRDMYLSKSLHAEILDLWKWPH